MQLPLWLLCAWPALVTAQPPLLNTSGNPRPTTPYTSQGTQLTANAPPSFSTQTASGVGGVSLSSGGVASTSMPTTAPTVLNPDATASSSANPSSTNSNGSSSSSSSSGLSSDAKIGIGVGVGIGVAAIVAGLAFFFLFRRRRRDTNGRYAPAQSVEQIRETAVAKGAAPPYMATAGPVGGAADTRSSLSRRTSNHSALRSASQRSLAQSTSHQQARSQMPGAVTLTPKAPRSPRLSFEAPSTRDGNRPQPPSIFTEVFSPVSGHHDDHEPVSPVSSVSEMGSRPPSPMLDIDC